jgi:hypothetical protein
VTTSTSSNATATGSSGSAKTATKVPSSSEGQGLANQFNTPTGLCFGGGELFVADLGNGKVKRVSGLNATPTVSLVMSGVPNVYGVDYGTIQDRPFLAAVSNSTGQIYAIDPTTNRNALIRTLAPGVTGVGVNDGRVIVANATNHTITSLRVADGSNIFNLADWAQEFASTAAAGYVDGISMRFSGPQLVTTGGRNGFLVADSQNHRIRRLILPNFVPGNSVQPVVISNSDFRTSTGRHGYFLGTLNPGETTSKDVSFTVQFEAAMTFYVTISGGTDGVIALDGGTNAPAKNVYGRVMAGGLTNTRLDGQGAAAGLTGFGGVEAMANGCVVFASGNVLRTSNPGGLVSTIGNPSGAFTTAEGSGFAAAFPGTIMGISRAASSQVFFVSGNQVWYGAGPFESTSPITPASFTFSRIGGDPGNLSGTATGDGNTVRFSQPRDIHYDEASRRLYICDSSNDRIVVGIRTGPSASSPTDWNFVVYAGTAVAGFQDGPRLVAQFSTPVGITLGHDNALYVGDNGNGRLRRIDLITEQVTTVAGNGGSGYADGSPGQFSSIRAVESDGAGSIYIYDFFRLRIYRNGQLYSLTTNVSGTVSDGFVDGAGQQTPWRLAVNPLTGTLYTVTTNDTGIPRLVAFEAVVP